jgi:molybdopterin converting factor subunit 1
MTVTVLYFASIRDLTGRASDEVELSEGAALSDLLKEVTSRYPKVGAMVASLMMSVNEDYAEPSTVLSEGDEVALIPPVSGG